MAAYELLKSRRYEIAALLTTVTEGCDRISIHGVRRELLEAQAESLGIALRKVYIPQSCVNADYESRMEETLKEFRRAGVGAVAFGDIFLEDLRAYRERGLDKLGMKALFPIWKRGTSELPKTVFALGFKAIVCCADSRTLDRSFIGKAFDEDFLSRLPPGVDPCGENGEFHSFVHDGPIFKRPIGFSIGEIVEREPHFLFCDLLPTQRLKEDACSNRAS